MERENWTVHSNLQWNTLVEQVGSAQPSANLFWFRWVLSSGEWRNLPFQSWASAGDSQQSSEISGFTLGTHHAYWCRGAFCKCQLLLRRRWTAHIQLLWAAFGSFPCSCSWSLFQYLSCCPGNSWWWCCTLKPINFTSKILYQAWPTVLPVEI